jgi:hypothetical protein
MSFFDSQIPVADYQSQIAANENSSNMAIPNLAPVPQPAQNFAKGGLASANDVIKKKQVIKVFEHYFKNLGVDIDKGLDALKKEISEGLQLVPFESSVLAYKRLSDGVAQIHFFTVGTINSLANDMQYFYKYLKKQGINTVYDTIPAPVTVEVLQKLGAQIEKSDNPKYKFKASI